MKTDVSSYRLIFQHVFELHKISLVTFPESNFLMFLSSKYAVMSLMTHWFQKCADLLLTQQLLQGFAEHFDDATRIFTGFRGLQRFMKCC